MLEDSLQEFAEGMLGEAHKVHGVVVGIVVDVLDPLMLGRVRLQLPSLDSADFSPWARIATPMAGLLSGAYLMPNPTDEVLVAFENGDTNAPYVIGFLWNALKPPPYPSPLIGERAIRSPIGNQLGFREAPPAVTLTTPDMTLAAVGLPPGITLASNVMITLMCGPTQVVLTPAGITITAPSVTIVSTGPMTETAASSQVTVAGAASIQAGATVTVQAPMVAIN